MVLAFELAYIESPVLSFAQQDSNKQVAAWTARHVIISQDAIVPMRGGNANILRRW